MKLKNLILIAPAVLAGTFLASCAGDDVVKNERDNGNGEVTGVIFEGATQTPTSRTAAASASGVATRTTATHIIGGGAKVLWENTDNIWVEDDSHQFRQSSSIAFPDPANQSYAKFGVTTGSFTGTTHKVVYTGKNSTSATEVEIKAEQTQAVTNSFAHLGESGDCGIATATKASVGNQYGFGAIRHKAAYLAIYPRIENNRLHKNVKIEKIVLTSTSGAIAGKYSFSATNGLGTNPTPASNASSTITLNTTSGEISSATRVDTCYYVVIAPGSHNLKIEYHIVDTGTQVSGIISKDLGTIPCNEGKMTDITAWVDKELTVYSGHDYYMWDAQKPYWQGYEWDSTNPEQPVRLYVGSSTNYPQNASDPRYGNNIPRTIPYNTRYDATTPFFKSLPNVNELVWYVKNGDPYYEKNALWVSMGHLHKGLYWFKKHTFITGFDPDTAPDGVDWRTKHQLNTSAYCSAGTPPASDKNKYFSLPAQGFYNSSSLQNIGEKYSGYGYYWSSSASPYAGAIPLGRDISQAYYLRLEGTSLAVQTQAIDCGYCAVPFDR